MPVQRKIRVLIVDDSAIVRKILTDALASEPDLEVVGTATDPYVAREKILALNPDVLTLDIEMPRMDGLTFLRKLMQTHPLPVIMISSLGQSSCRAAVQALEYGAVEVLAKPDGPYSIGELRNTLASKIRVAASARIKASGCAPAPPCPRLARGSTPLPPGALIAIGASTGGAEAIASILKLLPADTPPILIVQHIPPQFSRAFALRLNEMCALEVKEAADGDELRQGRALIAPGDYHMLLRKAGGRYTVQVKTGERVCYQRPSVDVLFFSVAEAAGSHATGVLLTGMGSDGAKGLRKMREVGARTMAQDEATCVVFGMPRVAIELGAAEEVHPLQAMPQAMLAARGARSHECGTPFRESAFPHLGLAAK
jgi:two-component system chemotaxis response regulator CheB